MNMRNLFVNVLKDVYIYMYRIYSILLVLMLE